MKPTPPPPRTGARSARQRSLSWRRRDAHEAQAEQAARSFAAGGNGLAAFLTPAPTACAFVPDSLGYPLPAALRAELEAGFGADLGPVRLHGDAGAARAAHQVKARAFVAGRDIYFAQARPSPFSAAGRSLIAHEIAHVIQQTGRAASGGRLRIEPTASGAAGVQRDPDMNQAAEDARDKLTEGYGISGFFSEHGLLHPAPGLAAVTAVLDAHATLSQEPEFLKRISELRMATIGKSDIGAVAAFSEQMAKLNDSELTGAVRVLYRDAFKALGAHDEAAAATKKTPELTGFASWAFYEAKQRGDGSWVLPFLAAHAVGKKYWPNAVIAVARIDFYGIARAGLDLDPNMAFVDTMKDAIHDALTYDPLTQDERVPVALRALAVFNNIRLTPFKAYKSRIATKPSLSDRYYEKLALIGLYKDENYLVKIAEFVKAEPEAMALTVAAGKAIAPIAARAETFWKRAEALLAASDPVDMTGKTVTTDEDAAKIGRSQALRAEVMKRLPSLKPLAKLEVQLIDALKKGAKLESGGLPSPGTLVNNLATAARAVEAITFRIDGDLARREKKLLSAELPALDPASADTEGATAAVSDDMVYGVVLLSLFRLQHWLLNDYKKPDKTKDADVQWVQRDEAAKAYQTALRRFADVATLLGHHGLLEAARTHYQARQDGVRTSYVALLAPFAPASVPFADFAKEFPTGSIGGFPISGAGVIHAVYSVYYGQLLTELQAALAAKTNGVEREKDYAPERKDLIANTAINAVEKSFKPPARYKVPEESSVVFVPPGPDRDNMSRLITTDPKDRKTILHHRELRAFSATLSTNQVWVIPESYDKHQKGFVIWAIDDLDKLAQTLAAVPGVSDMPIPAGGVLGFPESYPTPVDWLLKLGELVKTDAAAQKALSTALQDQMKLDLRSLEGPLRRATNNERRVIGPMIAAQWERVQGSMLKDPKAFYEAPKEAMRLTLNFFSNIQPATPAEQQTQMALLMLEMAPVLKRKLGMSTHFGDLVEIRGTGRFDIVMPLHPYVKNGATIGAALAGNSDLLLQFDVGFAATEVRSRTNQLAALAKEFEATVEEHQAETVMEGLPDAKLLHVPGRGYPLHAADPTKDWPGTSFQLNGNIYQLITVHRRFQYQPEMLGQLPMIPTEGQPIGVRKLTIDGEDIDPKAAPVDLLTIMYTPHGGKTQELVIRSDNVRMLSELTYALHISITMEALGDLAVVLNEFASVLTALIQLAFPGAAAPIAAAEIAGSVIRFWGSPEFATIKGVLTGDVGDVFTKGLNQVKSDLTGEKLWGYFLFGDNVKTLDAIRTVFEASGRVNSMRGRSPEGDDPVKKSSISRVVAGILSGGGKVADGAARVHDHAGFAFRKVELSVQASPWAALILRVVARNLHRLDGVTLKEAGVDAAADALQGVQDTMKRFHTVLETLNEFELPDELVPLETIIEMVVNFVIDHLPFKYRKPLQGVRLLINSTPLRKIYDELFKEVATHLREAGIDPNILWREYAKKELDPHLKEAATGISDEAHTVLRKVPFLKDLEAIDVPAVATSFVANEAPPDADVAPKLADERAPPLAPPELPRGRGVPLSHAERAAAQSGFGHDFGHVRIHRGSAVDTGLRSAGARAAASGSHVWLDSSQSASGSSGRDLLHHELAHVLQQSGPRPLGQPHSNAPVGNTAAGGGPRWRIDAGAERQADSLAAATSRAATAPRAVSTVAVRGPQPSFTDVVQKLFRRLGDPTQLIEHAEAMTKRVPGATAADLDKAAPGVRGALQAKLIAHIDEAKTGKGPVKFANYLDGTHVKAALLDYITDNRRAELREIDKVLFQALKQVELKKDKGTSKAKTEKVWIMDTGRLETVLEEFFFGMTSVSVDVELNTTLEKAPDGKQHKAVNMADPFKTLNVTYVHLPMIGGTSHIWDHVIDANFPKAGTRRAIYQAKTRLALQGLQPSPLIFTKGKGKNAGNLMFSPTTLETIKNYVDPPPARDLPGDEAPIWTAYSSTTPVATTSKYGQIGLRLGFYRDKKNPALQQGTDRTAHHTVQYLLIEYLVNSKDRHKPFPAKLSDYPNVTGKSQQVEMITKAPGGNTGVKIAENDKGDRGPNMPTILLSNHAHNLGDVHISPKPDDLDTGGGASQGAAIDGKFRGFLGDGYKDVVRDKEGLAAMTKKRIGKPLTPAETAKLPKIGKAEVTPDMLATAIFNATCKTYTWMRDTMNEKLERAIDKHEADYYKALVATATSTTIYQSNTAQAGYVPGKVGADIIKLVKEKQKTTLEGPDFGFEPMT